MSDFSVVIPTLQRAAELNELVDRCALSPFVREVLVINNARPPLSWMHPNVHVLQQDANIYVNPAWNLGVQLAEAKYLALLNDDILFDVDALFSIVRRYLRLPFVGVVGPNASCFNREFAGNVVARPIRGRRPHGYGVAMFMRRNNYQVVPDSLKIFYGDDWQLNSRRIHLALWDFPIATDMSVTSGEPIFNPVRDADTEAAKRLGLRPM